MECGEVECIFILSNKQKTASMKKSITLNAIIITLFAAALVVSYFIAQAWPTIVRG